jgi:L-ascorbate metabolism protein UlaG (beta-lactamase superfamily)
MQIYKFTDPTVNVKGLVNVAMKFLKILMITLISIALLITLVIFAGLQLPSIGKIPSGERLERIKKSRNYKDGKFQNLTVTPDLAEGESYFSLIPYMLKSRENLSPSENIPSVKTDLHTVPTDKPVLTWFGHSTYLIQTQGKTILVDPVFSERASMVQFMGPKAYKGTEAYGLKDLPQIDAIIISHDHYDHLDYGTITALKDQVKAFYVPLGIGSHLEHWGVAPDKITELDWWDSTSTVIPGVQITATPARHFSGRAFKRLQTLWASYVIQTPDYKIFIGGDSGYEKHFKAIGDKFGPFDLVMLECGQYDTYWPYIHMMPEQTAQAAVDLQAKVLLPVHWGKFTLAVHEWNSSAKRVTVKANELGLKLTTPMLGEQIIVDSLYPNKQWWAGLKP